MQIPQASHTPIANYTQYPPQPLASNYPPPSSSPSYPPQSEVPEQ